MPKPPRVRPVSPERGWRAPQTKERPPKPPRRTRTRADRLHGAKILMTVVVALLAIAGMLVSASAWTARQVSQDVDRVPEAFPQGARPEPVAKGLTFLLVGMDTSPGSAEGGEPGMVAVGHITDDLALVSLPPDVWVDAADGPDGTLRDAFSDGGPSALVSAVETMTDVRIEHYAEIDLEAFRGLTNSLGGITVDVPEPYRARGEVFEPGPQRFDGEQALAYMRNPRSDPGGAAAGSRQQLVVQALFARVREMGLLSDAKRLPDLIGLVTASMDVDDTVDAETLTRLATELAGAGRPGLVTVPLGGTETQAGVPVQTVDVNRAAELFGYVKVDSLTGHLDEFK